MRNLNYATGWSNAVPARACDPQPICTDEFKLSACHNPPFVETVSIMRRAWKRSRHEKEGPRNNTSSQIKQNAGRTGSTHPRELRAGTGGDFIGETICLLQLAKSFEVGWWRSPSSASRLELSFCCPPTGRLGQEKAKNNRLTTRMCARTSHR